MYADEVKAQAQAQKAYQSQNLGANTCGEQAPPSYPPTLRQEAEKSVEYHRERADKADMAAAFFRTNPAFDEFIRLVRSGAIQL